MAIIPKGCTAINTFTVPFEASEIEACYVTYAQNRQIVIEKKLDEVDIADGILTVYLTQKDTLGLETGREIKIQIRAKYNSGDTVKSDIVTATTDEVLKGDEI